MNKSFCGLVIALAMTAIPVASDKQEANSEDGGEPFSINKIYEIGRVANVISTTGNISKITPRVDIIPVVPEPSSPVPTIMPSKKPTRPRVESRQKSNTAIERAKEKNAVEFGPEHWDALYKLVDKESSWIVGIKNPSETACGLFQANPCSKQKNLGDLESELEFGFTYIKGTYGNPSAAWAHWLVPRICHTKKGDIICHWY